MNAEERRKLKEQVSDMVLTGFTYTQIAHQLGITTRTIVTYIKEERKEAIQRMHATAEEHLADFEKQKEKRLKRLWAIALDENKKESDRLKAMALLQNEDQMSIKRKQLLGLIPQDAPQVAIQNNNVIEGVTTIADSIRRNYPELLVKFQKNKAKVLNERKEDSTSNQAELTKRAEED
jgi:predicted transcriptional regulator